jgi:FMN phosphatase YigB (HAD superfamily)
MRRSWIVVDLDGTLCDCSHRVHWAQAKQWDEFHAGIPDDKPHEDVAALLEVLGEGRSVLLCTGRNERHRSATEKWLRKFSLDQFISELIMRQDDQKGPDHELKLSMTYEFFGSEEKALESVLFVLDDRDRVVQAWRDAGFRCWQVAAGSY